MTSIIEGMENLHLRLEYADFLSDRRNPPLSWENWLKNRAINNKEEPCEI